MISNFFFFWGKKISKFNIWKPLGEYIFVINNAIFEFRMGPHPVFSHWIFLEKKKKNTLLIYKTTLISLNYYARNPYPKIQIWTPPQSTKHTMQSQPSVSSSASFTSPISFSLLLLPCWNHANLERDREKVRARVSETNYNRTRH